MDQPIPTPKTGTKLWAIILVVVGAVVVLGLVGLFFTGKFIEWGYNRAIEATNEDVVEYNFNEETGSGSGVFKDEEGNEYRVEARGEGESLIRGFPKDFPIMPGTSNLESSVVKDLNQIQDSGFGENISTLYTAAWLTKKSIRETFDYYRSALKDKGWRVLSSDMIGEEVGTISFERPEGSASGLVTIYESETDPEKTEIGTLIGVQ
jgi:hypothetical protein